MERKSGLLIHISSLSSDYGIGTIGTEARAFVDFLAAAKQKVWQILPLNPTGYGDSPYQALSAFAGNFLLIDLQDLVKLALLKPEDLLPIYKNKSKKINYNFLINSKLQILNKAFLKFKKDKINFSDYNSFCKNEAYWLDEFALFMALKSKNKGAAWFQWADKYKYREPKALKEFADKNLQTVDYQKFMQYIFFKQWHELKKYAQANSVEIVGDLPFYPAYDSVDVWANPANFLLDKNMNPQVFSGVPPDRFSDDGQLWGNPIYNWHRMEHSGFAWWLRRIAANLNLYDIVRLDHFRAFEAFWQVPFGEETAKNGEWVKAPGDNLLFHIFSQFTDAQLIAEDLGVITNEVRQLMAEYNLSGMRVFQFAFDGNSHNEHLPHNYDKNSVAYLATHDNDTLKSWYKNASKATKKQLKNYLQKKDKSLINSMIKAVWASSAMLAILPLQDLLQLGKKARMNTPATVSGNWQWQMKKGSLRKKHARFLAKITEIYGR